MATIGLWKIESRLQKVIDYVANNEKTLNEDFMKELHHVIDYTVNDYKTEKQYYVTTLNCDLKTAAQDMNKTKMRFGKQDGIMAYHGFQSFKEGEVTPEIAHEIGVKLAEELWGDRFEVIVSTHLNTNHLHNHFVFNSVSFLDGKKYYDKRSTYAEIRHISDCLCEEYGLSVLKEKTCRKSRINYANYYQGEVQRSTYHSTTKEDIDRAIAQAYNYQDFIKLMRAMDYDVINRYGKLSVRRYPYKRNIRIEKSYGEEYSIDNINTRISNTHMTREPFIETHGIYKSFINKPENKKKKIKGIYGLFMYYCYLLKVFPNEYPNKRLSPSIRADIKYMDRISDETNLLVTNSIETYEQFYSYKTNINKKLEELMSKRELLWKKTKRIIEPIEKDKIVNEIKNISNDIDILKKNNNLCKSIEDRIPIIKNKTKPIDDVENVKEVDKNEFIK